MYRRDKSPTSKGSEVVSYSSRQQNNQCRRNKAYSCVTHALGDHQTQLPDSSPTPNSFQHQASANQSSHGSTKPRRVTKPTKIRDVPAPRVNVLNCHTSHQYGPIAPRRRPRSTHRQTTRALPTLRQHTPHPQRHTSKKA